jgi:ubiquitin C-terminal hydrolase
MYVFKIDQTNSFEILQSFIKNFANENQSIISDIFYGVNHTGTQCSVCQITKYNYQAYFFLIFPLEEIRKSKIEKMKNQILLKQNMQGMMGMNNPFLIQQNIMNIQNLNNMNTVNIYDCFDYNEKFELFVGENSMYCNNCNRQLPASYQTTLYTVPGILILILNRGKGIEFRVKLEFAEDLNLMNYVKMKNTGYQYKLIGVVTHMGESGASGHFIAYCKSPISTEWFKYNDDFVTPVGDFKSEIIDYAKPYILFYQKIDG